MRLHVFAEYPVHQHGILMPVNVPPMPEEKLLSLIKRDYGYDLKTAEKDGHKGYTDQTGRFFAYCLADGPMTLGLFLAKIGASEDVMEAFTRDLH